MSENKGQVSKFDALHALLEMSLDERIEAVAEDVRTKKDRFRKIDPESLARALDVPLHALEEASTKWDSWCWDSYIKKQSLRRYVDDHENLRDMIERNEAKFDKRRFRMLMKRAETGSDRSLLKLLTGSETRLLARLYALDELNYALADGYPTQLAYYSVQTASGKDLEFQAEVTVEFADVLGPYEEREGKFAVLKNCIGQFGNDQSFWETDSAGKRTWFEEDD